MPLDQSEAIVLRSFNVGNQDKIVVLFSREKGLLRAIAKGARKFGNRFGSSLEPMSLVRIFYHEKERKELLTLSHCDLLDSCFEVLRDYRTSCTLSYFAELIEEFFPSRAGEDILFRLLLSMLQAVKEGGNLDLLSRYFEAWFLQINGLLPDFKRCKKCRQRLEAGGWLAPGMDGVYCSGCAPQKKDQTAPEIVFFLDWAKKNPPPRRGIAPFAPEQLEAIRKTLQSLIVFHLEKEPRSLHFLK